ncbi:hypothetical protein GWQ44_04510 [Pseudomonas sp. 3MA1]|nr:hypothetical protein [Pseudomonas sp. 3MA1]
MSIALSFYTVTGIIYSERRLAILHLPWSVGRLSFRGSNPLLKAGYRPRQV